MMRTLKWLDKHAETVIMVALLVLMCVLMLTQVFMRRVMGQTLSWSEEVTRYFFVWSVFLSISLTLRKKSAMKLDLALMLLPRPLKNPMMLLAQISMLAFFIYMSKVAFQLVWNMKQTSATLGISLKWVYASTVIGFILAVVRLVQLIIDKVRTFSVIENDEILPQEEEYAG